MSVIVYNINSEDFSSKKNCYYIGRPSIFGNPFTFNGKRSNLAKLSYKTREEAIEAYGLYFKAMLEESEEFKQAFDEMYEKYKNGEDIYLGCFCKPLPCHGDVIAKELQKRLILEKQKERIKK